MSRKRDEFIPLGDVAEAVELSGDRALASRAVAPRARRHFTRLVSRASSNHEQPRLRSTVAPKLLYGCIPVPRAYRALQPSLPLSRPGQGAARRPPLRCGPAGDTAGLLRLTGRLRAGLLRAVPALQ